MNLFPFIESACTLTINSCNHYERNEEGLWDTKIQINLYLVSSLPIKGNNFENNTHTSSIPQAAEYIQNIGNATSP